MRPRLLVFASGSAEGGGSGFEKLVEASRDTRLEADIVGVVSNHESGGVQKRAEKLGVKFFHFPGPWTADRYQRLAEESHADFFALSGWLKLVVGLDLATRFSSRTVFNIHPGPQEFSGPGMYGHHVHEAVLAAYRAGTITHTGLFMHFVTEEYDRGPVFFKFRAELIPDDTAETIGKRVNLAEHQLQPLVTDHVVKGNICWDGINPSTLVVPKGMRGFLR
jgi:phosphoribosylglycinamide formyltransferase-1